MLQNRKWKVASAIARNEVKDSFSFMSYNVLADTLLQRHPFLYKNTKQKYLGWNYRAGLITKEILHLLPDIVCMQEVEPAAFEQDFQIDLDNRYKGVYCRRMGDAVDGCAMFWRRDKLKLIHNENIDYKEITKKDNIAIISVFELIPFNNQTFAPIRFSVATTHLLFNTNRGYLKLAQLHTLVQRMEAVSHQFGGLNTIICGDFNMTEESVMYHYMTTGETEPFLFQDRYLSGQNRIPTENNGMTPYCYPFTVLEERKQMRSGEHQQLSKALTAVNSRFQPITKRPVQNGPVDPNSELYAFLGGETGVLKHGFQFQDAILGKGDIRYYSTFHTASQALVDFVFFSPPPSLPSTSSSSDSSASASASATITSQQPRLITLEFLEPPLVPHHGKIKGNNRRNIEQMPSKHTPSDHIPLVVEFGFV
ncbi:UNVERIFIED_CONTAM: hypothetical protein HDU68_003715 [Siphonaria sp. JEL0065]|nr:hypothetical protein HDU68_003715 [Siphonaria sp. JEL0065]